MEAIIKWIAGFDAENETVKNLKTSSIKSRRVVGRGTLTVDSDEIRNTEKFKSDARKAAKIVQLSQA